METLVFLSKKKIIQKHFGTICVYLVSEGEMNEKSPPITPLSPGALQSFLVDASCEAAAAGAPGRGKKKIGKISV